MTYYRHLEKTIQLVKNEIDFIEKRLEEIEYSIDLLWINDDDESNCNEVDLNKFKEINMKDLERLKENLRLLNLVQ